MYCNLYSNFSGRSFCDPFTRADGNQFGQADEAKGHLGRCLKTCLVLAGKIVRRKNNISAVTLQHHTHPGSIGLLEVQKL